MTKKYVLLKVSLKPWNAHLWKSFRFLARHVPQMASCSDKSHEQKKGTWYVSMCSTVDSYFEKGHASMRISSSAHNGMANMSEQVATQAPPVTLSEGSLFMLALVRLFVGLLWFEQLFWKLSPSFAGLHPGVRTAKGLNGNGVQNRFASCTVRICSRAASPGKSTRISRRIEGPAPALHRGHCRSSWPPSR